MKTFIYVSSMPASSQLQDGMCILIVLSICIRCRYLGSVSEVQVGTPYNSRKAQSHLSTSPGDMPQQLKSHLLRTFLRDRSIYFSEEDAIVQGQRSRY